MLCEKEMKINSRYWPIFVIITKWSIWLTRNSCTFNNERKGIKIWSFAEIHNIQVDTSKRLDSKLTFCVEQCMDSNSTGLS